MSRAASSLEIEPHYHCDDYLAARLVPGYVRSLLQDAGRKGCFPAFSG